MPKKLFWTKFIFKKEHRIWLFDGSSGQTVLPNDTDIIGQTFKAETAFVKWRECCSNAIDCCIQNSIYLPNTTDHNGYLIDKEQANVCPATWDGFGCWQDSSAGLVAQHPCPDNVYFLGFMPICRGTVTKQCYENGSWFIRNDHEWSDYSNCAPLPLYATRMFIGGVWHVISAIVIGPALIILHKFPNRGGSKRVRILSNLLFWLLLNSLMAAFQKIGIIGGIFLPGTDYDDPPQPPGPIRPSSLMQPAQGYGQQPLHTTADPTARQERSTSRRARQIAAWGEKLDRAKLHYDQLARSTPGQKHTACDSYNVIQDGGGPLALSKRATKPGGVGSSEQEASREDSLLMSKVDSASNDYNARKRLSDNSKANGGRVHHMLDSKQDMGSSISNRNQVGPSVLVNRESHKHRTSVQDDMRPGLSESNTTIQPSAPNFSPPVSRCKRNASDRSGSATQPAPVVFVCWFLSLGIRITRLLGYAWMFTGAVYLCSILHYAPAEPPTVFIKWLMILTGGFPVTMGLVYLITRTIYEPSPLTLIVKLPYYYLMNDTAGIDYLWATQLNCWMFRSKYPTIEEIADFPNFCLVILNAGLFVFTLIIMCRISRPGCTRQAMSLSDYFKAAGTLVVLYGGHYALFAYKPAEEGCFKGQFFYYAFLFVDGIQGVAVSYVFCYKTVEGKEIISKWLASCRNRGPKWCQLSDGSKNHTTLEHETSCDINKSSAHNTRSNNCACNGKDVTTELI